jgi:hypothetical protein
MAFKRGYGSFFVLNFLAPKRKSHVSINTDCRVDIPCYLILQTEARALPHKLSIKVVTLGWEEWQADLVFVFLFALDFLVVE